MSKETHNVLFLCTGNSARSIMVKALVTTVSRGRSRGYSAGSVHPHASELAERTGYPAAKLRSKSWNEFAEPDAPRMDFIVTVCNNAAAQAYPYWPADPTTAHWSFEDPAAVEGSDTEKRAACDKACGQIRQKMLAFLSLPLALLDMPAIGQEVAPIGASPV
jgi:arsenate reductase